MKSSAIFLILLTIFSSVFSQRAFLQIETLLRRFNQSNINEQHEADIRELNERKWCDKNIGDAIQDVAKRLEDVNKTKKHIQVLTETQEKWETEIKEKTNRIKVSKDLLEKFKIQRCESNLLFVKNLRDHLDAVNILNLLRADIVTYFNSKRNKAADSARLSKSNFVQRVLKLDNYANLLDISQKNVLSQLTKFADDVSKQSDEVDNLTKTRERTDKEIGDWHIDNKRGKLNRLDTPSAEGSAEFDSRTERRVLTMIDGLIKHLKESRDRLIKDEIQSAEDFVIFQRNTLKEIEYLEKSIESTTKNIIKVKDQIVESKEDLIDKTNLLIQSKLKLESLKRLCNNKYEYFANETLRRRGENKIIEKALALFKIKEKAENTRASRRSDAHHFGERYKNQDNVDKRVLRAAPDVQAHINKQVKERNQVAL